MDKPADSRAKEDQDKFRDLMRRVREGSEEAAWELVRCYGGYVRRAVRRVLSQKMRAKFDSLDFVQLVWRSFFRARDEADCFEGPQHLVVFLAGVASKKVQSECRRRLSTEKYGVEREVQMRHLDGRDVPRQAEAVDIAIAQERWERFLEGQPARYRRILALKLQGHTPAEIGTILDLDPQTIRRFLNNLLETTVA